MFKILGVHMKKKKVKWQFSKAIIKIFQWFPLVV